MMFVVIGAVLAALFMLVKEGVPIATAMTTGVILTRGHRRVRVERALEPDRFQRLLVGRVKLLGIGVGAAVVFVLFSVFRDVIRG